MTRNMVVHLSGTKEVLTDFMVLIKATMGCIVVGDIVREAIGRLKSRSEYEVRKKYIYKKRGWQAHSERNVLQYWDVINFHSLGRKSFRMNEWKEIRKKNTCLGEICEDCHLFENIILMLKVIEISF